MSRDLGLHDSLGPVQKYTAQREGYARGHGVAALLLL